LRNLFICFLMATVAYLVQQGPDPVHEAATYLGILVVFPILGARLFRNWRLPPAVGAIAAGAILAQSNLLDAATLQSVASFRDAAFVWLGLYVGSRIPRVPTLRVPNLTVAASIVVSCSLLICLATGFLPLTLLERLQIGFAGAICAPVFTSLEPDHHRDEIGLAGLTTAIAILLLGVTALIHSHGTSIVRAPFLTASGFALLILVVTSELAFRSLKYAASGPGRYLIYIVTMGVMWKYSAIVGIHPALLGCFLGVLFGLRTRHRQDLTQPLVEASTFAGSFVLGFISAETNWSHLGSAPPIAWFVAFSVVIPMVVGKVLSGSVAGRLTHVRPHRWLRTLPLGVAAMVMLPTVLPDRLFLGSVTHPDEGGLPTLVLGVVCLPLTGSVIDRVSDYVASRRKPAASSGGMELT
jgi:Kef-type K+ transport system membrane component KefB